MAIVGVGMHPFGKHPDKSLKDLGREAVWAAIDDAGIDPRAIGCAYVGNSLAGLLNGQEGIRGQVILHDAGLDEIPVINVENACASGTTALRGAWLEVAAGTCDVTLALGVEKMFVGDTARSLAALASDSELELAQMGMQFSATYAAHPKYNLRGRMEEYGWSERDLAEVVVKNSRHGSLNPYAQHRRALTADEVLGSPMISDPLTLYMCSSIGDGAGAAIVCAKERAAELSAATPITIAAAKLRSGHLFTSADDGYSTLREMVAELYEEAGVGAEDIDVAEVHDAMAPVELLVYESLGFCGPGEGPKLIRDGTTAIGGEHVVNPSGGLTSRGHPVGATGLGQVAELVWQLRGQAGPRQAKERPLVALAHNQGGLLAGMDSAAYALTLLTR
ncbi:MAG TPA: thiolase family protein [Thermoleophilaceae bacterium]|nr:thiolase family protein [Thermoleophilaceae bacterium]